MLWLCFDAICGSAPRLCGQPGQSAASSALSSSPQFRHPSLVLHRDHLLALRDKLRLGQRTAVRCRPLGQQPTQFASGPAVFDPKELIPLCGDVRGYGSARRRHHRSRGRPAARQPPWPPALQLPGPVSPLPPSAAAAGAASAVPSARNPLELRLAYPHVQVAVHIVYGRQRPVDWTHSVGVPLQILWGSDAIRGALWQSDGYVVLVGESAEDLPPADPVLGEVDRFRAGRCQLALG